MKRFFIIFSLLCLLNASLLAQESDGANVSWYSDTKSSFVLSSSEQLLGLSKIVTEGNDFSGKTITLSSDIDLTNITWRPIGDPQHHFCGTFEGGFNTIYFGSVENGDLGGLFGYISNATIKNVKVSFKKKIQNIQTFGGIAAYSDEKSIVENCSHEDSLIVKSGIVVGGVVGCSDSYLLSCANNGPILCEDNVTSVIGGIVASGAPTIENCQNIAHIIGRYIIGGLLGKSSSENGKVTILNSCNSALLELKCGQETPSYRSVVGGLVGSAGWITMTSCWNTGKVNIYSFKDNVDSPNVNAYAAGLIGEGAGKLKNCYNMGEVFIRNVINAEASVGRVNNVASGLIGMNTDRGITELEYSYNAGKILTYGMAPIKVSLKHGGVVGDFSAFMPKMTGVYSLEGCCENISPEGLNTSVTNNVLENQVSLDIMTSEKFLQYQKTYITLNSALSYVYDIRNKNNGFPVLKTVVTSVPSKNENSEFVLKANSLLGGKRYFCYWITGMEQYSVDLDADNDFSYKLGKIADGEHNVKAYVVLPDNQKIEGEKMSFVINKTGTIQFESKDINTTNEVYESNFKDSSSSSNRTKSNRYRRSNRRR